MLTTSILKKLSNRIKEKNDYDSKKNSCNNSSDCINEKIC